MMFAILLAASTQPTIPVVMRGSWDLPGKCETSAESSDTRLIIRREDLVFVELVFTPARILVAEPTNWTATGEFEESGERSQGRLNLRMSKDGRILAYTNTAGEQVGLIRCRKQAT